MLCNEVEIVVEQQGFAPLPEAVRNHLAGCGPCRNLIADLSAITHTAAELPAEVEPPSRIWISLRAQLEQEGIIRPQTREIPTGHPWWWHGFRELFRNRALATVSAGLLIFIAGVLQLEGPPTSQVVATNETVATRGVPNEPALMLDEDEHDLQNVQLASDSVVAASYRQNLQIVDQFISDCEQRVQQQPEDTLAREYLNGAYQQKAELLSAMMERGRGNN